MENNNFNNKTGNFSEYPYGELPLKYTKQGQEQLKRELKNKHYAPSFYNSVKPNDESSLPLYPNQNGQQAVSSLSNNANTQKANEQNGSGFGGNGLDLKTILPLLGSIGGNDQMESFQQLLPLLNGGGQMDMNTLLKLFGGMNKKKSDTVSEAKISASNEKICIDNLKRVDEN